MMHTQIFKPWHQKLYNLIEKYDTITIFRHVNPDGDAYGSSFGLGLWLKSHFPNKKIYITGKDEGTLLLYFFPSDFVTDETIKQSLALVVDTANKERISDQRYQYAQKVVKIDHHPYSGNYGDYEFIEESMSSSCEIVTEFIRSFQKEPLSYENARVLYAGMLTDTLSFTIASVTSKTLYLAAWLLESGLDVAQIQDELFLQDSNIYDYVTYLRGICTVDNGLVYAYVSTEALAKYQLDFNQAKEFVNVYKSRKDAKIWVLMIEMPDGLFNLSIRSRNIVINDIATKFGGGGHKFASATKNLKFEETQQLLIDLKNRL
ncbi:MAG: bifunctional oligoribonuclease/PAP phosphatase NrnA [Erysipelothrix sp.]|nr:bifunctional oligoribonuclease/PAP phosphatase NrnA [Erysipelothrix sp.]